MAHIRLEELLADGRLVAAAAGAKAWSDVARALGVNLKSLHSARERWFHKHGTRLELHDVQRGAPAPASNPPVSGALSSGPHLAAFDRGDDLSPVLPAIPRGHYAKGVSTLIDATTGEAKLQWIKSAADDLDVPEVLRMAFGGEMPRMEPVTPPSATNDDLLAVYPMGDPHIGMLAWEAESGENFDLAIAERELVRAVDILVHQAPAATTALVITVGDTLHSDGLKNATTKGTPVDVDGRTPKMIATAIRTFRRVIERALQKHQNVHVKIARGNHDEMMSLVLAIALGQFYENNPRVVIDTSPAFFHHFFFGLNFITVTHGNRQKAMDIMGVMAATMPREWGETKHRRAYCGHFHHEMTKEVPGVVVDYLPTLAAKEAYAAAHGYIAGRSMRCDVIHRRRGLIGRNVVGIDEIQEAA